MLDYITLICAWANIPLALGMLVLIYVMRLQRLSARTALDEWEMLHEELRRANQRLRREAREQVITSTRDAIMGFRPGVTVVTPQEPRMAVRPQECMTLTDSERIKAQTKEQQIDKWLRRTYTGVPISIVMPKALNLRVLNWLRQRYGQVGWEIREDAGRDSLSWSFSQKANTEPEQPEQARTRPIDLTPRALPAIAAEDQVGK